MSGCLGGFGLENLNPERCVLASYIVRGSLNMRISAEVERQL
jgi:hypothetical protein